MPISETVSLKVFNALGEQVATLANGELAACGHSVSFNAGVLPNGIYFYRLTAGSGVQTGKMAVMK